jgi:hypothetical protein
MFHRMVFCRKMFCRMMFCLIMFCQLVFCQMMFCWMMYRRMMYNKKTAYRMTAHRMVFRQKDVSSTAECEHCNEAQIKTFDFFTINLRLCQSRWDDTFLRRDTTFEPSKKPSHAKKYKFWLVACLPKTYSNLTPPPHFKTKKSGAAATQKNWAQLIVEQSDSIAFLWKSNRKIIQFTWVYFYTRRPVNAF